MKIREGLTFDDVLLVPKYSAVMSRKNTDLSVDLGKGVRLKMPIVTANMKNVTGSKMANLISNMGGLPILHRFCTAKENVLMFKECKNKNMVGGSVGVSDKERYRVEALIGNGCRILCVDVAHGHHALCIDMVRYIANKHSQVLLIAGNVATSEGAEALAKAGADVVKVGVGPGSLCTTRIETGNGVPQISALDDVERRRKNYSMTGGRSFKVIADGGIRRAGDVVKALCFSDAVMVGSILAGTEEAPGSIIDMNGRKVKRYEGSSTHKTSHIEGVRALVEYKGPAEPIVTNLLEGIRSGLSYQGCQNLRDLKESPQFVKVTNAGLTESHPHSVMLNR